jgi:hypothetical protein
MKKMERVMRLRKDEYYKINNIKQHDPRKEIGAY